MRSLVDRHTLEERLSRDPLLVEVSRQLNETAVWVAGGWVRDRSLGLDPPDLDLVMQGNASQVKPFADRLAAASGRKARLLGKPPRAVFRIEGGGLPIEIWPLSELSPEADALRRDYSCNAMLWQLPAGPLIDPAAGLADISCARVRAVCRDNLCRDPVRLLRGPRMVASLPGFDLDETTGEWIRELAPALGSAVRERVGAELLHLVSCNRPGKGIELAQNLGLLQYATPNGDPEPGQLAATLSAARRLAEPRSHPITRAAQIAGSDGPLAWLIWAWGPSASAEISTFAWSHTTARRTAAAASLCDTLRKTVACSAADRREVIATAGDAFATALALASALAVENTTQTALWRRWWRQWQRSHAGILAAVAPISSHEVARICNLSAGPDLGRMIRSLRRAVIRRDVRSAAGARRWLRKRAASQSFKPV